MPVSSLRPVAVIAQFVLLSLAALSLPAAPAAPKDLRVSDSAAWPGQASVGEIPVAGVSLHPWFSVLYSATTPTRPVAKLRVQVSQSAEFSALVWDSGYLAVAAASHGQRTAGIAYAGPTLIPGVIYHWRAATQDDQSVSGPFSSGAVVSFCIRAEQSACDLRVQTNSANAAQGHPVSLQLPAPGFSAEFAGPGAAAQFAQVEVSLTADFSRQDWISGWVATGSIGAGQRCPAIPFGGSALEAGDARYWRIRFSIDGMSALPWSEAASSFVYDPLDPSAPAPAGFSSHAREFGTLGLVASDMVVTDFNGDNTPDAIFATEDLGLSHRLFLAPGAASPGASLSFGSGTGSPARLACADFNVDGAPDVVVFSAGAIFVYLNNSSGVLEAQPPVPCAAPGDLLSLSATDLNWDGWPDLVIATTETALLCPNNGEGNFGQQVTIAAPEAGIRQVVVADLLDSGCPEILVLSQDFLETFGIRGVTVYALGAWSFPNATALEVMGSNGVYPSKVVCSDGQQVAIKTLDVDWASWVTVKSAALAHPGRARSVLLGDVDGDSLVDACLLMSTGTLLLKQTTSGFIEHEFGGYSQDGAHPRGALCDMDMDGRLDLTLLRPGALNQIFFNRARMGVSIHDASSVQPAYGEGFIDFEVELTSPPAAAIEVTCTTVETEGGEGEGDGISDIERIALAQSAAMPQLATTARLIFVPGQTSQYFRVRLTKAQLPAFSQFQVLITSSIGAVAVGSTATGTVHAAGTSSSGPAATAGLQRDWKLRGQVNAVARKADGTTYFGGEFDGAQWNSIGVAAVDGVGNRLRSLPAFSGTIAAVATDESGCIYVGGAFSFYVSTYQFKNIAKLTPSGAVDTAFRPNPNGRVNAIALHAGSVYFGGVFSQLEASTLSFRNLAQVFGTGAMPPRPNRFGVSYVASPGQVPQTAEVLALKVANNGYDENFLIVGGRLMNSAWCSQSTASILIQNLALFNLNGLYVPKMPLVSGEVRALAVADEGFSTKFWSRTILFGGNIQDVVFRAVDPPALDTRQNLLSTNFEGGRPDSIPSTAYSHTPVNALLISSGNQLWVGRNRNLWSTPFDPLAIYDVTGGNFALRTSFSSGLTQAVHALALGENEVLAAGDFMRPGAPATSTAGFAAVFSNQSPFPISNKFRGGFDYPVRAAAAVLDSQGRRIGYALGGQFTKLIAMRGNLAAMNSAGELLTWGPSTNGPVHAMVTNDVDVFFGGNFTSCTGTTPASRRSIACVVANETAVDVGSWDAQISGASAQVRAMAWAGTFLLIGGDFTTVKGAQREDAAALSVTSTAQPSVWNPGLTPGASSMVFAICLDGKQRLSGWRLCRGTIPGPPWPCGRGVPHLGKRRADCFRCRLGRWQRGACHWSQRG